MPATNTTYFIDFPPPKSHLVFARHETFAVRFNWLKKGIMAFRENNHIFQLDDAPVILGVGKNMVKSIRYWCIAFKLLHENQGSLQITDFANTLFNSDEYLQDKSSLWLLHWNLLSNPCLATTWEWFFNYFNKQRFTLQETLRGIKDYLNAYNANFKISDSSLNKDLLCLLRMYYKEDRISDNLEESINNPFAELGLINSYEHKNDYVFNIGSKPGLTNEVIVSCSLDFAYRTSKNAQSISLSRLLHEKGSPGVIFKLNEQTIYNAIEDISYKYPSILSLSDTAGLIQMSYKGNARAIANQILQSYYNI